MKKRDGRECLGWKKVQNHQIINFVAIRDKKFVSDIVYYKSILQYIKSFAIYIVLFSWSN